MANFASNTRGAQAILAAGQDQALPQAVPGQVPEREEAQAGIQAARNPEEKAEAVDALEQESAAEAERRQAVGISADIVVDNE